MSSIPEALYVTVTGPGSSTDTEETFDHVWATNDPDILEKIDTSKLEIGVSRLTDDPVSSLLPELAVDLNEKALREVGGISRTITNLSQRVREIVLNTDEQSVRERENIDTQVSALTMETNNFLSGLSGVRSFPAFDPGTRAVFWSIERSNFVQSPDGRFLFYKPVLFRSPSDEVFYRGVIRLEVSVDTILANIASDTRSTFLVIGVIALIAIALGAAGALILANIIVLPIRRLVRHVELIRDTYNKEDLAGVDITIRSHGEIAVLGDTINDMTHGLVKAAAAASDLSIGKETQKKFIPLDLDREGNKLSSGSKDTKNAHFFGYYEGAKGVSGDYFDYQELEGGRYYAIIKCDVAGKGIPAALIMIQVATMFLNYFKQWKPTQKGMQIQEVVYQINDFIEALGFKGRFAAFTLGLFDTQTGVMRFCNAGDNIVHFFDASEGTIKTLTLPETPATGVLPNFLVESKGGYSVQTLTLDHGDFLLLYTDGIEEAKRIFRDASFEEGFCDHDVLVSKKSIVPDTPLGSYFKNQLDTVHENHSIGQDNEEMGPDRVAAIVNAVMGKKVYTLHTWHNPEGESRDLTFDFTMCEGSLEEVIMAMVSVEKMFRCYKSPKATDDQRVMVDKKIDSFLKEHFLQYRDYCSDLREVPGMDAYIFYAYLQEDAQYDDLTILGIKRK
jgi:hypothetical protein